MVDSVRVPQTSATGKEVECETVVVNGVTYYRQNVKAFLYDGAGNPLTAISDHVAGYGLFCISEPIGYQIAEGGIAGHESYRGFGYDDAVTSTLKDINGYAGNTNVPASAILMRAVSLSASDTGTLITSGTSTGGSTTTLIDTGKNFITLGVVAGDFVLNDADVSLGTVVTIDSATQITFQPTALLTYALKAYRIARAGGTGAAVCEIHGLDANWNENSEFIILNGATPVPTVKTYIRNNNFHVMGCGTNGTPVGAITLRDNATGTIIYNNIEAGLNMSLQAHYTVPAGKVMFITSWHADPSANKPMKAFFRSKADFHDRALIPVWHTHDMMVGARQHKFDMPVKCPAKCDVKISAQVIGAGTGEVGCGFEFWIEDEH